LDLKDLKSQMSKLSEGVTKLKDKEEKKYDVDERFFRPTKDSAGNISCVIRFLPQSDFSKSPYAEKWGHFIKRSGKTFGCYCLNEGNNKGTECDVCEKAKPYWDEYWTVRNQHGKEHPGCKEALKGANIYTAKPQVVTNILVVKNPADPDTEGKTFLYNMPVEVLKKYKQKLFPKDDMDETSIVYHPVEGRDFKLDAYTKVVDENTQFNEYEGSYFFDKITPISDDENKIVQIINETHDLEKYIAETIPKKEDVSKKFNEFKKFLGVKDEPVEEKRVERVVEETVEEESIEEVVEEITDIEDIDDLFKD